MFCCVKCPYRRIPDITPWLFYEVCFISITWYRYLKVYGWEATVRDQHHNAETHNEETKITTQRQIDIFDAFLENQNVEHHDVVLRLFIQSLDGEVRKWFKSLPNNSITTQEEMENSFLQKWGEKRDHTYMLTKFNVIKKKSREDIYDFIKRFNKLYKSLLAEIKPAQTIAKLVFVVYFDS